MSKIIIIFICNLMPILCFAAGDIVYLDQNQLQQKSNALAVAQKELNSSYETKLAVLQKKQNELNGKLNNASNNSSIATKLSASLLQLQQQINDLESERDAKAKGVLTQYFAVERIVLKQLLEDRHYSYILNLNAVYMTESVNDVTSTVLTLTDRAYEQKYLH